MTTLEFFKSFFLIKFNSIIISNSIINPQKSEVQYLKKIYMNFLKA